MPAHPPSPDLLPTRLRDTEVLRVTSRVGLATPEQIAALIVGNAVHHISVGDSLRMERRLDALVRRGLLARTTRHTWYRALRYHERTLYRLTDAGLTGLGESTGTHRRALLAIHGSASRSLDGWSDERTIWFASYPRVSAVRVARAHLTQLVRSREAERRPTRQRHHVPAYSITDEGTAALRQSCEESGGAATSDPFGTECPSPTRPPRPDQAIHHLLLVSAAASVLYDRRATLLLLRGDEDLRSQTRVGRTIVEGDSLGKLPDGRLQYLRPDRPGVETVDIEILIANYSDEQIASKYAVLAPGTLFFAPTADLCHRVRESGLSEPGLIF